MTRTKVGVLVGIHNMNHFYLDVEYRSYKELISKVEEECANRYKKFLIIGIFLKDGNYLQKPRDKWYLFDTLRNTATEI